jgi:small subunit ribosomal protein S6
MRLYETAFLIAPDLSDEDTEALIEQMAEVVSEKEGKMRNVDKWGKRKLAYQIQKFDSAFYVFFTYDGEATIPAELERRFKQHDSVIRYLTVVVEDRENYRRKKAARPDRRPSRTERRPVESAPPAEARPPRAVSPPKPVTEPAEKPAEKPDEKPAETLKPETAAAPAKEDGDV